MDDQLSDWPPAPATTDPGHSSRAAWIAAAVLGGGLIGAIVWAPFLGPLAGLVVLVALVVGSGATLACAAGPTTAPPVLQALAAGARRVVVVTGVVLAMLAAGAVFGAMATDPGVAMLVGVGLAVAGIGVRELTRLA